MMLRCPSSRVLLCAVFCLATAALASARDTRSILIPLTFEQNRGQAEKRVRFLAHAGRSTILLSDGDVALSASGNGLGRSVRMHLLRAAKTSPVGETPTGGLANYYKSKDRKQWLTRIPLFSRVRYSGIYPGIDAVFRGHGDQLEYDFEVAPGSSPNEISFSFEGAERILFAADGGLDIVDGDAKWHLMPPEAYQMRDDVREPVPTRYDISQDRSVSFEVENFDPSIELVIDPVVEYANQLPATAINAVSAIQVDVGGNPIIAGEGNNQAIIVKLDAGGDTILYANYLGGTTESTIQTSVWGLALDGTGNAYIAGITGGDDFPITSILGPCTQSCNGGFVTKFAPNGSLIYSAITYPATPRSITVDASGSAYVAGDTGGALQPVNAFQTTSSPGFFAKLNPSGTAYDFASFFSGPTTPNGRTEPKAIGLDGSGNIFIAGNTNVDPPLVKPWQSGVGGIFLSQFAPDGKTLLFSTRFGSSQNLSESTPAGDALTGMVVGSDGTVYLAGYTQSQDFPYAINSPGPQVVPGGYGSSFSDMFATAIDPTLTKLTYSVHLGQGVTNSIALGSTGHLYIAGMSTSNLLPLKDAVVSDVSTGGFFLELDGSGIPITVSEFGGQTYPESPIALAIDASGRVYLTGTTNSFVLQATYFFGFSGPPDPVLVGAGAGSNTGVPFAIIGTDNAPQISLNTVGPFLTLRNAGSADLHISSITLGGRLSKQWGNCGVTIPASTSCILTVSDSNGMAEIGSVTIVSDAQPSVQSFPVTLAVGFPPGTPIGDQLWSQSIEFDYPPQLQGTPTAAIPITIWNVGVANATLNSITATDGLSETDNCGTQLSGGAVLAPGANCVLQVSLTPDGQQPQLNFVYDTNKSERDFYFLVTGGSTQQQLLLSATAIDFGTQQVNGVALPRVLTATNTGATTVSAPLVSIQGDPEFNLSGNACVSALAPHESCEVGVQFNPTVDGAPAATINISGQLVALNGNGRIGSLVQVFPLELDFPPVTAGYEGVQTITLTNSFSSPVAITAVSFSLPDFSETDSCQGQVPANGSCAVQVAFYPQQLGSRQGAMTVYFSGGVLTQVVTLAGSGIVPLQISPSSLIFGSPVPGTSSDPQAVEIGNGSQAASQSYSLSITGDFVISQNGCPNPMPGFRGCGINISFQPKKQGPEQGVLTVGFPGIPEQSVVPLSGGAGPGPNIDVPSTLNFGNRALAYPALQTATITNNENVTLALSNLTISGNDAVDFGVAPGQCSTIAPGTSCGFQVNFTPGALGQRAATLTISDNGATSPQSISLKGNAVNTFTLQAAVSSATVASGNTATYQISSTAAPSFTGIVRFRCDGAPQYATCSVQPASIDFSKVASANLVVTVSTTTSTNSARIPRSIGFLAATFFLPLLFLRRRPRAALLIIAFLFATISFGCGGVGGSITTTGGTGGGPGTSSTPPGYYPFTVTGYSAIDSDSEALVLTIM